VLTFSPQQMGTYPCKIVLRAGYDVRILTAEGKASSSTNHVTIEMTVPARGSVTQEIPVINKTKDDWTIQADLKGMDFSGPRALLVPAGTSKGYPLVFKPVKEGKFSGELSLFNPATEEKVCVHLVGTGEEPLAEDRLSISVQTRKETISMLKVPTLSKESGSTFNVSTDLPCVSGAPNVSGKVN